MYRLLNPRFTSLRKFPVFSSYYYEQNFEVRSPACLQIQPDYCLACARFQSTVINPNAFQKKIRKRGKKKKYSDLVVVTDGSTKQQKARIKNLTWADLQTLAATNLSLGELYKLEDLSRSHTYSNLTVIDNIPGNSEVIEENQVDVIPEQIEALDETEAIEEDIDPDLEEAVDEVETETSKKLSHQVGIRTLASFVGVCTSNNTPMKGLYALIFHNCRASRGTDNNFIAIKNVKVYNTLLKGFAAKSDITRVEEVLKMMKEENVKPNAQTYVQILECYGRVNAKDQYLKQIRIYAKEAVTNGVNFDRIMNEGVFLKDERKVVLAALRKVDPKYEPLYWKPVLQYNNHLVDHLNHDSQLCQPSEKNDAGGTVRNFTPEFMDKVIKQQLQMEKQGFMSVKNIENRGEATDDVIRYRAIFQEHLRNWEETATKAFERDLAAQTAKKSPLNFEAYLRSIPTKDFVSIIVAEARNMAQGSETYSPTVTFLHRDMGHKVYFRFQVLRKQKAGVLDKVIDVHTKYCHEYARPSVAPSDGGRLNPRQRWQWIEHERVAEGATLKMDDAEWTPAILKSLGEFLYRIVMHDLKVDVNAMRTNSRHRNYLPAFYTVFRSQGRIVKEEVKPHPFLCKLYRSSMPENLSFPAYELPMYCPPVPWTGPQNGSYLVSPCDLLRLPPQASLQKKRIKEMDVRGLYPSLDALNQLAAVPWRVNRTTLDVILEVFRGGGSARLDVPETPENLTPPPAATPDMDKAERFRLFKQRLQYKRKKSEMYSLWCDCLYKLSLANHFRDDVFWLPHNMDFRGRVYPVPPHLTHLGSDLSRSMLVFAESRPLGPDGLDWLKIHLVNLTGLKKRNSTQERLDYANSITEEIFDSADRPLKGRKWWAESDEPWQTLACCMEIVKAVRSGDPENYRTHFPIHQDGSCNGLQHYAALGRDEGGGHSVNLCPSAVPQDVYGAVVALVEEQRRIDAMLGSEIAKLLEGFVKRKVIKQTIMTTVYGVTRFGARLQIARQLKDIEDFPKDAVWNASSYLTVKTFESLRTMFTSTREIQDWFTECARAIAVSGQQVEWITPLGLPIVQPYSKYKALNNNAIVYKSYHIDQFEKPNVMKQKNAFPPNFIHSLDSSHMMLTSLHCEREGITFVSVHDCYWTHPSSVHIMNKICREQFVALHSEPILEDLSMFLTEKYSYSNEDFYHDGSVNDSTKKKLNRVLRKLPPKGDLDINRVLYSVYFFS